MKIASTLVLLLAFVPALGQAQTADAYVAQGRAFLAAHDLLNANKNFASAVALAPTNPDANVLLATTRVLTLANQPAGEAFLDRLGFAATNRSVYGWTALVPADTNGVPFAPAGVSAAEIPAFLLTNCLPQIIAADANLAVVSDTNYTLALNSNETSTVSVTLDYGDLLLLRAGLNGAECACYTVCPWDFDVQLAELRAFWTNGASTAQEFLAQYPSLLTFTTTNNLGAARQAFSSAAALYTNASAFIRNRPLSTVRLFNYDPITDQSEANFRTALVELNESLNGPVVLTWADSYGTNLSIDMANQFSEAFSPRAFFPEFSGNAIVAGTLPDPTFGGVVQGLASWQVEDFLGNTRHFPFVSRFTVPQRLPGGLFQIRLDALEDSIFAVEVSTNLQDWTNLTFGIVHQGVLSFTDPGADEGPRRFYRALDRSGAVGVDLTVLDARTGGAVPGATVVLSVGSIEYTNGNWTWISDYAVTNYTDSAGHTIAVLGPGSDSSYVVTVTASGYAAWTFDGYLPGDQHRTLSACLAPPGYDPPNDNFAQRQSLAGANPTATGDNVGATSEQGEPYPGVGQTVWWTWTAPSDGAVTIDISGSSFATALAVFTGNTLTNLVRLVSLASGSQASFFVKAGVPYQICVDSSDGSSGLIVLRLYYTAPQPPVFTSQPTSQALQVNGYDEADFNAAASGTGPISYQWQKDGQAISGATGDSYAVYGAEASDAGAYTVVASNAVGIVTSAVAVLTVIPTPPNDMFANATVITGTNSIVYGYDWSATSQPGEPSLGIGQSVWWTWTAPMDGAAVVDIRGGSGGQVLGVYTGGSVSNLTAIEEFVSVADFFVQAGTSYQMEVDSADSGGRIVLRLYYTTPSVPVFDAQPASLTLGLGDTGYFYAHASGTVPLSYQWRVGGVELIGQTDAYLYISDLQSNQAGIYTVVATNAAGSVTSAPAVLTVIVPFLHSFATNSADGQYPAAGLVQASNGSLYGTTGNGGSNGGGTVFKLNSDGSGYEVLYNFGATVADGLAPAGGLVQASNGSLYGTTWNGGSNGRGTVFRLNPNGSGYEVLYNFGSSGPDGQNAAAGLVQATNGSLYGTTSNGGSNGEGTVFKLNLDGSGYEVLYNFFGASYGDGQNPSTWLVQASNGSLYGTTYEGGQDGYGTLFKLSLDGSGYEVLYSFGATFAAGLGPLAGLVQASNGSLYGTTSGGGSSGAGTVFKLNSDGSDEVLYSFGASAGDGWEPQAGLVQASNGSLYGTTWNGGSNGRGTVFKLNPDGSGYGLLYNFGSGGADGQNPAGELIQASNGFLYGTTYKGGLDGVGTVFGLPVETVITAQGSLHVTIAPLAAITAGAQWQVDGGTWQNSGATVTNLPVGSHTVSFSTIGGWWGPANQTVTITNGAATTVTGVYTVATSGALTVTLLPAAAVSSRAQWQVDGGTFQNSGATVSNLSGGTHTVGFSAISGWWSPTNHIVTTTNGATTTVTGVYSLIGPQILHSFATGDAGGQNPSAGLVQASSGSLYGTARAGGSNGLEEGGDGTLFKLNLDGSGYEVLHSFGASQGDGQTPYAGVVQASNGYLYGTTVGGGNSGGGTVFKLNSDGSDEVLYSFAASQGDGWEPQAGLVQASNGSLYGTTAYGGSAAVQGGGGGTVFKINSDGSGYEVLYSFGASADDGANPVAGLVQASNGSLYGTTSGGGSSGDGTVFKLDSDGSGYTVLHNFGASVADGQHPDAVLVQATNGALYGTTGGGGSNDSGTVFKLNPDGSGYEVLHNFGASVADGQLPLAGLVQASNGSLYGTTYEGGSNGEGTVFKLNPDGSGYEVLDNFGASGPDGQNPRAGLIQASNGSLYGTTFGGWSGGGAVFTVSLGPP